LWKLWLAQRKTRDGDSLDVAGILPQFQAPVTGRPAAGMTVNWEYLPATR
jgi:hypothetical protein